MQQAYQAMGKLGNAERTAIKNVGGGIAALANPNTRQDYLTGAKQSLQDMGILNKPANRSNVPAAVRQTMTKATQGFSPAAKARANSIKIQYSPINGYMPFGASKILGSLPNGAAGVYSPMEGANGQITIDPKYAQDPSVLRHELMHSMDNNLNYGIPSLDDSKPHTPQEWEASALADRDLANTLSIYYRYLNGLGLADSRGLYPSLDRGGQRYVNHSVDNPLYGQEPSSRTKDVEGLAYIGGTGNEYAMPNFYQGLVGQQYLPNNMIPGRMLLK